MINTKFNSFKSISTPFEGTVLLRRFKENLWSQDCWKKIQFCLPSYYICGAARNQVWMITLFRGLRCNPHQMSYQTNVSVRIPFQFHFKELLINGENPWKVYEISSFWFWVQPAWSNNFKTEDIHYHWGLIIYITISTFKSVRF